AQLARKQAGAEAAVPADVHATQQDNQRHAGIIVASQPGKIVVPCGARPRQARTGEPGGASWGGASIRRQESIRQTAGARARVRDVSAPWWNPPKPRERTPGFGLDRSRCIGA